MKQVVLGNTGIKASYLGLGTSAAYNGVVCPAKLKASDYPELLCFGYEQGITFWDTSHTYGTHGAIKEALRYVPRKEIVICTKTVSCSAKDAERSVYKALSEMGIGYVDIFLMQCVRNRFDLRYKARALEKLHQMKESGLIRAVGLASHGISALEAAKDLPEIDLVMGRLNYSGHIMDSRQDNLKSVIAGIPVVKKVAQKVIPAERFRRLAVSVQKPIASEEDHKTVLHLLKTTHDLGKPVVAIKVLGEGHLAHDVRKAIGYVTSLPFVDAIVLGCCSKEEISQAVNITRDTVGCHVFPRQEEIFKKRGQDANRATERTMY